MNPTFKGGSLGGSQADLVFTLCGTGASWVCSRALGPEQKHTVFCQEWLFTGNIELVDSEFFSVQKQWSSCRDSPLLTAQYPKPASGSFGFPRSQLQTKYLISIKAFKHTQCSSIFFDDSDWVALHPLCSFL